MENKFIDTLKALFRIVTSKMLSCFTELRPVLSYGGGLSLSAQTNPSPIENEPHF